ncbi:hypothetical protein BC835DRAFT_1336357 [Cytidiella melzeri]|nr:hypothetical protein BC835DRAFT_1336357 [Cytidiella melzeri]
MASLIQVRPSKVATGISLHVEGNGDEPSQVLNFMKDKSKVVTIGRKSTQAKHSKESTDDTALFRCPVISRRHAQIIFSECGDVCISDMKSHHGTHILRLGETVSRPVPPDVFISLEDGDIITFGKSVGRDETLVRPMIVRIRMLFSLSSLPASPTTPLSTVAAASPTSAVRAASTGRYGLALSVATDSGSSSDDDSEIEEYSPRASVASCSRFPLLPPAPHMYQSAALGLLGTYLPRIHTVEESHLNSNRFSPIEVSSASPSRSSSVVELQAPSQPDPERNVVGAWPTSVSSSNESTPERLESLLRKDIVPLDFPLYDQVGGQLVGESSVAAAEPFEHFDFAFDRPSEPEAGPVGDTPLSEQQVIQPAPSDDEAVNADRAEEGVIAEVPEHQPASTENRAEELKTIISDFSECMSQDNAVGALGEAKERKDVQVQANDARVKHIVEGTFTITLDCSIGEHPAAAAAMKELRDTMEAERAREQEALKAQLAEAEAFVNEAKALRAELVKPETRVPSILTLKRKRDELDDIDVAMDALVTHVPHECSHGRPIKRQKSLAMRVVSGVAKTTAIAAVGAVVTWSALAFS